MLKEFSLLRTVLFHRVNSIFIAPTVKTANRTPISNLIRVFAETVEKYHLEGQIFLLLFFLPTKSAVKSLMGVCWRKKKLGHKKRKLKTLAAFSVRPEQPAELSRPRRKRQRSFILTFFPPSFSFFLRSSKPSSCFIGGRAIVFLCCFHHSGIKTLKTGFPLSYPPKSLFPNNLPSLWLDVHSFSLLVRPMGNKPYYSF